MRISTSEFRRLDWTEVENKISIFGTLKGRSRILHLEASIARYDFYGETSPETDDDLAWLAEGWISDAEGRTAVLETQGKCLEGKWASHQIWGFQMVDSQRRHVRKMLTWRDGAPERALLVYVWLGKD
jgi:uncharacterized protein involved in copper resistance